MGNFRRWLLPLVIASLVVPASSHAASPGLVVSGFDAADIDRGIASGAKEIVLFANWGELQPSPDARAEPLVARVVAAVRQVNAAGRRVLLIVNGTPAWANGGNTDPDHAPLPEHDADFARFTAGLVRDVHAAGGKVDRLQPWNEPDDPARWKGQAPSVERYAALLGATYDAVKAVAPAVQVFAASTAGANHAWIGALVTQARAKLDGVAIDLAPSCATDPPDRFYREADGRFGRFAFVGFLEVLNALRERGHADLPVIVPIMGVSSTGGGPTSCTRGAFAGKKPSGVSEAEQARILTAQYACLANHPQIAGASWFRLEDTSGDPVSAEFDHYGLYRVDGSAKPALQAFKDVAAADGAKRAPCADLTPPAVHISWPPPGLRFDDRLDVQVKASDRRGVGLARISLFSDAHPFLIRSFTERLVNSRLYGLTPWQGSRALPVGAHTLRVVALDRNGNLGSATVRVEKVAAGTLPRTRRVRFALPRLVVPAGCTTRTPCRADFGRLRAAKRLPSLAGKVHAEWQWRDKRGRWHRLVAGDRPATTRLVFGAALRRRGTWRVRAVYHGASEFKAARTPFFFVLAR